MPINRGEDKPLLVSIFEGKGCSSKGSDDEAYTESKYGKPLAIKRWKELDYGGQNRAKGFMMGAASIFRRWPGHLMLYWIVALAFCSLVIGAILLTGLHKTKESPFSPLGLQQSCLLRHKKKNDNPDRINVYLHVILNEDETFQTEKHDSLFRSISQHHPNHMINVFVLYNDTSEWDYIRNIRFQNWEAFYKHLDQVDFFDTFSAEENDNKLLSQDDNIGSTEYKNVKIIRSTFSNYFKHSPLRFKWRILPPEMIPFAFRVLSIWENGGITMPWKLFKDKTDIYCVDKGDTDKFKDLVKDLKKNFQLFGTTTVFTPLDTKLLIEDLQRVVDVRGSISMDDDLSEIPDPVIKTKEKVKSPRVKEIEDSLKIPGQSGEVDSNEKSVVPKSEDLSTQIEREMQRLAEKLKKKKSKQGEGQDIDEKLKKEFPSTIDQVMDLLDDFNGTVYKKPKKNRGGDKSNELERNFSEENKKPPRERDLEKERQIENIKREMQRIQDKLKTRDHKTNNAKEADLKKRVKRDLNPNIIIEQVDSKDFAGFDSEDDYLSGEDIEEEEEDDSESDLFDYDFDESDDDDDYDDEDDDDDDSEDDDYDYYDSSDSDSSYSGLKSPKFFRANTRNLNEFKFSSSEEPSAETIKTSLHLFSSSSESDFGIRNYYREEKLYVNHAVFDDFNVFAIPQKSNLVLDRFGYYYSAKRSCNVFLGHLISNLQSEADLSGVNAFVESGLNSFCRGRKYSECSGISLL